MHADAMPLRMTERFLQHGEKPSAAEERWGHRPELTQDLVPLGHR